MIKSFKKILLCLVCLFLMTASSCNNGVVIKDGIKYKIYENQYIVSVVGKNENIKELIISEEIDGYTVTSIVDCFNGTNITKVVIPNSVQSIGGFTDCKQLKEVTLSNNFKIINSNCFKGCSSLEEIVIKSQIEKYAIIGGNAFENCTALKSLTIENINNIWAYAFKGCSSLTKVYLDKNLKNIRNGVFEDCRNLEIYCEIAEKPEKWQDGWNGNAIVHWGCTKEDYLTI